MDIEPTEEQRALAETLDGLLRKRYDHNARLKLLAGDRGWSEEMWAQYAELGLLGLPFPEEHGGAGMGVRELAVVMECFGRALVLEPYLATVVLGGGLVAAAGTPEQQAEILPKVAAGDLFLAAALDDAVTAREADGAWRLDGQTGAVLGGDCADRIVVAATTPDEQRGLFLVDAADIRRSAHRLPDGLGAADLHLDATPAQALGGHGLDQVLDTARAMLCCEAVGAMERMLWLTVDYLKTREQFGAPLKVFQALQHRAADMYVEYELAKSMALLATLSADGDEPEERRKTVLAAKLQVDGAARHVAQEAVQMHGGVGVTMEFPVGHYLRRTTVIAHTLGDTYEILSELGEAELLI